VSLPLLLLAALPEPDLDQLADAAKSAFLRDDCGQYDLVVTQRNDAGALGDTTIQVSATMRLEGERWSLQTFHLDDPGNGHSMVWTHVGETEVPFVVPLLGELPGEGDGFSSEGRRLLEEVLRVASSSVGAESAGIETVDGRELYRLDMLLGGGWSLWHGRQDNTAAILIDPESHRAREWRLAVHDPTKLQVGRLSFLEATLRVDPAGLPLSETLHTRGRLGPFSLTVDRQIAYTRTGPCEVRG
jgi:hypothetical protein